MTRRSIRLSLPATLVVTVLGGGCGDTDPHPDALLPRDGAVLADAPVDAPVIDAGLPDAAVPDAMLPPDAPPDADV